MSEPDEAPVVCNRCTEPIDDMEQAFYSSDYCIACQEIMQHEQNDPTLAG